jgi:drug/metabolite transporter (DMT)-like permease
MPGPAGAGSAAGTASEREAAAAAKRSLSIGLACAIVAAVCFSAKAIFIKLIYAQGVDATTTFALRMMIALPFFLAMGWWCGTAGLKSISRRDWWGMGACGLLGFYLSSYLDFIGLSYIPASLERLILFLYPTFVVLLGWMIFRTRLTVAQALSLVLSYSGVMLCVWDNLRLEGDASALALGVGFTLASAITYACYVVASARIVPRVGSMRFTSYASSVACGFSIAHFFITHGAQSLVVPGIVYVHAFGMGTVSTVLPILLVAEALRRMGANQVALISTLGPIATLAMAALVLGETITTLQMAGAALVIAGVMLVSLRRQAPA